MYSNDKSALSAVEAKSWAQWLAFAPFAFQATVCLRDLGLLAALGERPQGADLETLAEVAGISAYGASVLLDFGVDLGLVRKADGLFTLDKTGHFVLNDQMTAVNLDFTRDVCYDALAQLRASIEERRPAGLASLGPWPTLYEGLTRLAEPARGSWFHFDHFYSDRAFDQLLAVVFARPVRRLLDVGGNTGRWALKCLEHDPTVRLTLMDLPPQLQEARRNLEAAGFGDRADYHPVDLLDPTQPLYRGADVIWMSQFLDCFSEAQIVDILRRAAEVMEADTRFYIVELFPDRQAFPAASMSLNATSLYFTCVANGNSRMYHYDRFRALVAAAGLDIVEEIDNIGIGHTVLRCARR